MYEFGILGEKFFVNVTHVVFYEYMQVIVIIGDCY